MGSFIGDKADKAAENAAYEVGGYPGWLKYKGTFCLSVSIFQYDMPFLSNGSLLSFHTCSVQGVQGSKQLRVLQVNDLVGIC